MNTSSFRLNEIDQTFVAETPAVGITAFLANLKRGPINKPSTLFTSWPQFRRAHGSLSNSYPDMALIKRALENGTAVRVANIKHYSDVGAGTVDATSSTAIASVMIVLSGSLATGHTMQATVNSNATTQAYSVSSLNTLYLFCEKLKALTGVVEDAYPISQLAILIVPKAGVTLTVTSSPTGSGAPTSTVTTESTIEDGSNNTLFALTAKNPGADYNKVIYYILPSTNGDVNFFDIRILHTDEPDLVELYPNLRIVGLPTVATSHYLDKIITDSKYCGVTYSDLSGIASAQIIPRLWAGRLSGGTDGGSIVDTDWIGASSSKTGLWAFDGYSDMSEISAPNVTSVAFIQALASYVSNRKDVQGFAFLGNFSTEAAALTARDNTLVDTRYMQFYAQNIEIVDPIDSGNILAISPIADVAALAGYSDFNFGAWFSFAGRQRGVIKNVLSVPQNFGTPGNYQNLNALANRQINVIVNEGNLIYIKTNTTAQKASSQFQFGNVTRFIIYLKKSLGPVISRYIEEPNDFATWYRMYLDIQPLLNSFGSRRALYGQEGEGWTWQGDQYAKKIEDLKINVPADISQGKYRAKLFVKVVPALIEIEVDITLTPSGVSFEEAISQNEFNQ